MNNLLSLLLVTTENQTFLSYQEVAAILGTIGIIAGVIIKLFYKPDEKLKEHIEKLEDRFDRYEIESKEKIEDIKEQITKVEDNIIRDRSKDNDNIYKTMEKIEARIEKLSDLIFKLIEK